MVWSMFIARYGGGRGVSRLANKAIILPWKGFVKARTPDESHLIGRESLPQVVFRKGESLEEGSRRRAGDGQETGMMGGGFVINFFSKLYWQYYW